MKKKKRLYLFLKYLGKILLKLLFRAKIKKRDIPEEGPLIVAANHISPMDPPLLGIIFPRIIHFFAAEELFNMPFIGWLVRNLGVIPVRRKERDFTSLKRAINLLRAKEVVAIFPQGGIPDPASSKKYNIMPGVAYLAIKTGAPILSICISGTDKVIPRGKAFFRRIFTKIYVEYREIIYPEKIFTPSEEKKIDLILENIKKEIFACENTYSGR